MNKQVWHFRIPICENGSLKIPVDQIRPFAKFVQHIADENNAIAMITPFELNAVDAEGWALEEKSLQEFIQYIEDKEKSNETKAN